MTERKQVEHIVTTHDGDREDESGVAAIVHSFIKHPAGAVQIIAFIGGMIGMYYTVQSEIKDSAADSLHRYEQMATKLDALAVASTSKMEAIVVAQTSVQTAIASYTARGDTRYATIIAKLGEHDVDIAKIGAGIDFIVKQYDKAERPNAMPRSLQQP